jgi:hypothetical protein
MSAKRKSGGKPARVRFTSAKAWAEDHQREAERRQAASTAQRLATRARNAAANPKPRRPAPRTGKPAAFYVPKALDPKSVPQHLWWPACCFLNLINWRRITYRANADGYSHLLYEYLERYLTRGELREVREALMQRGVVECDKVAVIGRKAYGYRTTPDYRKTHRVVCTDDALNRRIWKAQAEEDRALLPVHRWLRGKLGLLCFDMDRARAIIATLGPARASKRAAAEHRLQRTEYCLRIARGDHWFSCDEYGRVHTPVTALESELRCCLSVNGHPLVNIDLTNSQPLLFGILARQFRSASPTARSRLINREFTGKNPYHPTNQTIQHHHKQQTRIRNVNGGATGYNTKWLWNLRPATPAADGLAEYLRVCERGEFYESLMTEGQRARGKDYRRRFKKRFYRVLFGRNRSTSRFPNPLRARFQALYPAAARVLRRLKKKNYRHSSHLLQNYEATLFIHRICGRIMRERPDVALFTIHDSILTTPDAVGYVRGVILDEFSKLGVTPTLREERYQ